jgi:hypothetical protein
MDKFIRILKVNGDSVAGNTSTVTGTSATP